MNPARETQLFQRGCSAVFVLIIAFSCLAFFVDRSFAWVVGVFMVFWLLVSGAKARNDRARLKDALTKAFEGFHGPFPDLKTASNYGFPSFTLIFKDQEVLEDARRGGHVGLFKKSVSELYGHWGSEDRPFDAEMAVWATFEGWTPS